jgi:hypothetical protein
MSDLEPGLDLHAWETRWAELEEAFADDPRATLPEACDAVAELVGDDWTNDELDVAFASARETADAVERGDDVDPGDLGAAFANLRAIRQAVHAGQAADEG